MIVVNLKEILLNNAGYVKEENLLYSSTKKINMDKFSKRFSLKLFNLIKESLSIVTHHKHSFNISENNLLIEQDIFQNTSETKKIIFSIKIVNFEQIKNWVDLYIDEYVKESIFLLKDKYYGLNKEQLKTELSNNYNFNLDFKMLQKEFEINSLTRREKKYFKDKFISSFLDHWSWV